MTVETYLDSDPPDATADPVDAPTYITQALGDHDPIASEFHAAVRSRGESAARDGHAAVVSNLRAVLDRLDGRELDLERRIAVLGGIPMLVSEYLKTRLVELAVHLADLSDSVGHQIPTLDTETWNLVARVITETMLQRRDSRSVALGLARCERYTCAGAF